MKPSENAIHFEAVKTSLRQDKNGFSLIMTIHPNDVPDELMRSWVGTRYMIAAVEIADNDQVVERTHRPRENDIVQYAGMLCREPAFQLWLKEKGWTNSASEDSAANIIRVLCGVGSRTEFSTNKEAADEFQRYAERYLRETKPR